VSILLICSNQEEGTRN